jgi:hypothetical protein
MGHNSQQDTPTLGGRELVSFMAMKHGGEDVVDEYCVEVEVELDDEDLIPSSYLAMARLYLGKRFNERGLFEEM